MGDQEQENIGPQDSISQAVTRAPASANGLDDSTMEPTDIVISEQAMAFQAQALKFGQYHERLQQNIEDQTDRYRALIFGSKTSAQPSRNPGKYAALTSGLLTPIDEMAVYSRQIIELGNQSQTITPSLYS